MLKKNYFLIRFDCCIVLLFLDAIFFCAWRKVSVACSKLSFNQLHSINIRFLIPSSFSHTFLTFSIGRLVPNGECPIHKNSFIYFVYVSFILIPRRPDVGIVYLYFSERCYFYTKYNTLPYTSNKKKHSIKSINNQRKCRENWLLYVNSNEI